MVILKHFSPDLLPASLGLRGRGASVMSEGSEGGRALRRSSLSLSSSFLFRVSSLFFHKAVSASLGLCGGLALPEGVGLALEVRGTRLVHELVAQGLHELLVVLEVVRDALVRQEAVAVHLLRGELVKGIDKEGGKERRGNVAPVHQKKKKKGEASLESSFFLFPHHRFTSSDAPYFTAHFYSTLDPTLQLPDLGYAGAISNHSTHLSVLGRKPTPLGGCL